MICGKWQALATQRVCGIQMAKLIRAKVNTETEGNKSRKVRAQQCFPPHPPTPSPLSPPTKKLLLLVQRALQLQTNDRQRNPFNLRLVCGAKVSGWRTPAEEIATRAKQMASRAKHGHTEERTDPPPIPLPWPRSERSPSKQS